MRTEVAGISSQAAVALVIGAAGLLFAGLAPGLLALAGYALYLLAIGRMHWIAVPLIVLALPFSAQPQLLGPLELATAEVATLLAALIMGADVVWRAIPARGRLAGDDPGIWVHRRPTGADWAAVAFLAAGLLSLLVTDYPKQSLRELRWVVVEPILFFLIARATITTLERVRFTLGAIVAAGVLAALVALMTAMSSGELFTLATRPGYPYQSPNHLGLFLGRAAAVALAFALFGPDRTWARIALVPIGLSLLRSLSLGAWLGVAAVALTLAALRSRRWLAGAALALLVMCAVIAVAVPHERTFGRFDPSSGTGLFRLQIWESSLHMIADHPLLGIGLDNFLYQYRGHYILPEAWEEPNISHPHNWVLHFWLALGIPGLVATVGMVMWIIRRARALLAATTHPINRTLGAATIAVCVDTLVHGSFDNSYFLFDAALIWWLFAALVSYAGTDTNERAKVEPTTSRKMGAELPL